MKLLPSEYIKEEGIWACPYCGAEVESWENDCWNCHKAFKPKTDDNENDDQYEDEDVEQYEEDDFYEDDEVDVEAAPAPAPRSRGARKPAPRGNAPRGNAPRGNAPRGKQSANRGNNKRSGQQTGNLRGKQNANRGTKGNAGKQSKSGNMLNIILVVVIVVLIAAVSLFVWRTIQSRKANALINAGMQSGVVVEQYDDQAAENTNEAPDSVYVDAIEAE